MPKMINIEVHKGSNENNLSVLRRFTKRVQTAGVLPRVRARRYTLRSPSRNTRRVKTLVYLKKKELTAELIKLGRINEVTKPIKRR